MCKAPTSYYHHHAWTVIRYHRAARGGSSSAMNSLGLHAYAAPSTSTTRSTHAKTSPLSSPVSLSLSSAARKQLLDESSFAAGSGGHANAADTTLLELTETSPFQHFKSAVSIASSNAAAFNNLGTCYENACDTERNLQAAAQCYEAAARLGSPATMYNLGYMLLSSSDVDNSNRDGDGKQSPAAVGKQLLELAWASGVVDAGYQLGCLYERVCVCVMCIWSAACETR